MKLFTSLLPLAALAIAQENSAQIPLSPDTVLTTPAEPQTESLIPLLGFGTWNLDRANATEAVSWAIQTGYRHIDCAAAYRNQDLVGKGIADGLKKTGLKRSDLWITSKLWNDQCVAVNSQLCKKRVLIVSKPWQEARRRRHRCRSQRP